jgi:hypothetical protein
MFQSLPFKCNLQRYIVALTDPDDEDHLATPYWEDWANHVPAELHLSLDITLVRVDGATCSFVRGYPLDAARDLRRGVGVRSDEFEMTVFGFHALSMFLAPWASHVFDPRHDMVARGYTSSHMDRLALCCTVEMNEHTNIAFASGCFVSVELTPCLFAQGTLGPQYLDAGGAAHALAAVELPWILPAGDVDDTLSLLASNPAAVIHGSPLWSEAPNMSSTNSAPLALNDIVVVIQLRNNSTGRVLLSSAGVLDPEVCEIAENDEDMFTEGQYFDNLVDSPSLAATLNGIPSANVKLDIIFARRDGAVCKLVQGASISPFHHPPAGMVAEDATFASASTTRLTPCRDADVFGNVKLGYSVEMEDAVRNEAPCWTGCYLHLSGRSNNGFQFMSAHHAEHALAMMPWSH